MGTDGLPLAPTWPKKAKQFAKKGRAEWVDDCTIRMLAGLPVEVRAENMPDETTARNESTEVKQDDVTNGSQNVAEKPIEVGDVVCLNSGGVGMTVMEIREDGMVACRRWAAMSQKFVDEVLPLKVIRRKEPQKD